MTQYQIILLLNGLLIFISIFLINALYSNKLLEKSQRNSLIFFSICFPFVAIILLAIRIKRIIIHLVTIRDLNKLGG